jgi:predicted TIM-barrel fold metal-dependent hydrolase
MIDGKLGATLGMEVQGGKKFEDYKASGETYEKMRKGFYEPHERLKDMDLDGIDAQVLFSNTGTFRLLNIEDPELQVACMAAYNDFLSEFCAADPQRLIGVAMISADDVAAAVREIQRVASLPGIRGVVMPLYPRCNPLNSANYDPLWAAAQDANLPLHVHQGTGDPRFSRFLNAPPEQNLRGELMATMSDGSLGNYAALSKIIFGGVLERFPRLKFVSVEGNIGWLGYFLERADRTYRRHRYWTRFDLPMLPSEYFHRQVYATFIEDRVGVRIRDFIGIDNLMWSSDYPHTDTTWPNSRKYVEEMFKDVPAIETAKIVCGNARRLYALAS